ncbi:MAG: biopolymer transporter ExbD [Bacteroidales bacterium]|jgi:biopolymer transport protein ExbD|nr:biopolymer transporter ExbD [Bacteroidales bacterium]
MGKFTSKGGRSVPGMNTSSMSDIVFMFLFFFMVISNMRESTVLVKQKLPQASEIQKLEQKSLVSYIYIGEPASVADQKKYGTSTRIQLNDQIADLSDIAAFVEAERAQRNEADRALLTTTLKCDKDVKMGDVTDVKQELRKAGALRTMYAASKRVKNTY